MTSLVAQTVKHLPTMWETWVQSLGWEDLLEKEIATQSSILVWEKFHGRRKLDDYRPWVAKKSNKTYIAQINDESINRTNSWFQSPSL